MSKVRNCVGDFKLMKASSSSWRVNLSTEIHKEIIENTGWSWKSFGKGEKGGF
jgi:hypothetical protein